MRAAVDLHLPFGQRSRDGPRLIRNHYRANHAGLTTQPVPTFAADKHREPRRPASEQQVEDWNFKIAPVRSRTAQIAQNALDRAA